MPLPEYQTAGSAGVDFYSRIDATVSPHETQILPSNFIIELPKGYFLLVAARSSAHKKGLIPANGVGIIDQDYQGRNDEIGILVYNFTDDPIEIKKGDRIAQGLVLPFERVEWEEIDEVNKNSRGGFGSTGS